MDRRIDILRDILFKKKKEYEDLRRVINSQIRNRKQKGMKTRPLMPTFEETVMCKSIQRQIEYLENVKV